MLPFDFLPACVPWLKGSGAGPCCFLYRDTGGKVHHMWLDPGDPAWPIKFAAQYPKGQSR